MELDHVVGELYDLPPDEFVAARERRAAEAKSAGDKELAQRIHGLRRPSQPAWAVNLLVRTQPEAAARMLALGSQLREAWAVADPQRLASMSTVRQQMVGELTQRACELTAQRRRPLRDEAVEEVRQTLDAALADPEAAREVCSGQLHRGRSYSGFGPPDVGAAQSGRVGRHDPQAAAPSARRSPVRDPHRAEREKLAAAARIAADDVETTAAELRQAVVELEAAGQREVAAEQEVRSLSQQLDAARVRLAEAQRERRRLRRAQETAGQAVETARSRAERARARLGRS